jgi:glycerophosphoryl diester phosphodiesterase
MKLAQLRELDAGSWFSPRFAGERVPTLREAIRWAGTDMLLNIELKSSSARSMGLEQKVVALVCEHHMEGRIMLSSFNPLTLRRVKEIAPRLHTGLLYAEDEPIFLRRAWLRPLAKPDALHPQFRMVNPNYMRWAQRGGHHVNVWAPNDDTDLEKLISLGVDMIITDRPDRLRTLLAKP